MHTKQISAAVYKIHGLVLKIEPTFYCWLQ